MHARQETMRRMALLRAAGVRQPYGDVNAKDGGYRFARSTGVDVPRELVRHDSVEGIDWNSLPDEVLLKPRWGATNRGVFALDRQRDGSYVDLLRGRRLTQAEVLDQYRRHVEKGQISAAVIVEELLHKPGAATSIPDDFKVYCFYDQAAMVMQRDMGRQSDPAAWRFKFWDRDWADIGAIKFADRVDPQLAPPLHGAAIIDAAERMGRALRLPFVRLDFYDTERGAVFGEVTMAPGPPEVFTPTVDEQLGRRFEIAAARLLAEDIAAGRHDHLRTLANPEVGPPTTPPPD
jgi:hypothetical protein